MVTDRDTIEDLLSKTSQSSTKERIVIHYGKYKNGDIHLFTNIPYTF